jgi:hypothetical protein
VFCAQRRVGSAHGARALAASGETAVFWAIFRNRLEILYLENLPIVKTGSQGVLRSWVLRSRGTGFNESSGKSQNQRLCGFFQAILCYPCTREAFPESEQEKQAQPLSRFFVFPLVMDLLPCENTFTPPQRSNLPRG